MAASPEPPRKQQAQQQQQQQPPTGPGAPPPPQADAGAAAAGVVAPSPPRQGPGQAGGSPSGPADPPPATRSSPQPPAQPNAPQPPPQAPWQQPQQQQPPPLPQQAQQQPQAARSPLPGQPAQAPPPEEAAAATQPRRRGSAALPHNLQFPEQVQVHAQQQLPAHRQASQLLHQQQQKQQAQQLLQRQQLLQQLQPLNPQILRSLSDKIYDKRKAAALEVERLCREAVTASDNDRLARVLQVLVNDFAYSALPNARNGGLIGLAAASIALGQDVISYLHVIVPPVLSCFLDSDSRVRYYACESMYNIAKVAKGEILVYFNDIFDALSKLAADPELSVKNGAELLDRLVKDTVAEFAASYYSVISQPRDAVDVPGERGTAFSLPRFIPLLSERIHTLHPFTRNYLISWITVLNSIPDLELVSYLPDFLDGLLRYLSDANADVRVGTATVLGDFLREIREAAEIRLRREHDQQRYLEAKGEADGAARGEANEQSGRPSRATSLGAEAWAEALSVNDSGGKGKGVWVPGQGIEVNYAKILEILLPHVMSSEEELQLTALRWINEFILLARDVAVRHTPQLVAAVLPCLAHSVVAIRTAAVETNMNLYRVITEEITTDATPAGKDERGEKKGSGKVESAADAKKEESWTTDSFDYQATVNALTLHFLNEHEETRSASLDWLIMLHKKAPRKILDDGTFPALLKTLSDSSEDVVRRDLQLLAQISSQSNDEYFSHLMLNLLSLFSTDRRLLETRGSLIIRQLCLSLNPERIYRTFAEILEKDEDLEFASMMVQNLNIILITAPELVDVRRTLRNLDSADGTTLFSALYRSWCHNAVATFSLCLLAQAYEHAASLLHQFAELEITVNFLIQIDKLVQLLESPVFTYLRLQLLEPDKYPHLFKCLYGILMLLPQSSAFATLRNRLSSVSSLGALQVLPKGPGYQSPGTSVPEFKARILKPTSALGIGSQTSSTNDLRFQDLLGHFIQVQATHEKSRQTGTQTHPRSASRGRSPRGVYAPATQHTPLPMRSATRAASGLSAAAVDGGEAESTGPGAAGAEGPPLTPTLRSVARKPHGLASSGGTKKLRGQGGRNG